MTLRLAKKPQPANVCKLLPSYGNLVNPEVLIVVDPHWYNKDNPGSKVMPIHKGDLTFLATHLEDAGIKKSQVAFISCAMPMAREDMKREKKVGQHLKEYRDVFCATVKVLKPKIILALGKNAVRQVSGRAAQITKVRGIPEYNKEFGNAVVFPMLSVSHVRARPEVKDTFLSDVRTLKMLVKVNYNIENAFKLNKVQYEWTTDISELLKNPPKLISADTETKGLDYFRDETKLLVIQLTWEAGKGIAIPIDYSNGGICLPRIRKPRLLKQLKELFENPEIQFIGHNFKFDMLILMAKLGIKVANYAHDTLLMVHAIDENMLSKTLDECVRRFVPDMSGFNDMYNRDPEHQGKSRMDLFSADKMLRYGCGDTDATFRLFHILLAELKKDKKAYNCYLKVTMPAMRAFCDIEPEGFDINKKALKSFEIELEHHQQMEFRRLMSRIPESIKSKYRNTGVGLKLTRAGLLRDMLFLHRDGLKLTPRVFTKTSTDENPIPSISTKQHLPYFIENPWVQSITDYVKNDKMLNTYVKGFYKYIYEGKIRPSFLLHGTVTGRTSSRNPNGQNFPKRGKMAKSFRRMFVAPPGWTIVESDYSQIELRVAAIMSGDQAMLKVYRDGGDIHETTAAGVMGISLEAFKKLDSDIRKLKRFQAKAVNFGFIYGMWWKKFKIYAKTEYGIDFTDREAEAIREAYFGTYTGIAPWHREQIEEVQRWGQVRSICGRVRHLPMVNSHDEAIAKGAQRQGINSPVQCFANNLGLMALARINNEIPHNRVKVIGFVHDAIVSLVKDEYLLQGCRAIKKVMETNPLEEWFGFKPPIPIIADVSVGKNLADMHELSEHKNILMNKNLKSLNDLLTNTNIVFENNEVKPKTEGRKLRLIKKRKLVLN